MIAASRGRKAEAVGQFQAADRKDFPARDSLQMQMRPKRFSAGRIPAAIQPYEEYLKYFPQDAAARMKLALGYYSNACSLTPKIISGWFCSRPRRQTKCIYIWYDVAATEEQRRSPTLFPGQVES